MERIKFCSSCGTSIPWEAAFCASCGAKQQPSTGSRTPASPTSATDTLPDPDSRLSPRAVVALGLVGLGLLIGVLALTGLFRGPKPIEGRLQDLRGNQYEPIQDSMARIAREAAAVERLGSHERARAQPVRWGRETLHYVSGPWRNSPHLDQKVTGYYVHLGDDPVGGVWRDEKLGWYWFVVGSYGMKYRSSERESVFYDSEDAARRACIAYLASQLGRSELPLR